MSVVGQRIRICRAGRVPESARGASRRRLSIRSQGRGCPRVSNFTPAGSRYGEGLVPPMREPASADRTLEDRRWAVDRLSAPAALRDRWRPEVELGLRNHARSESPPVGTCDARARGVTPVSERGDAFRTAGRTIRCPEQCPARGTQPALFTSTILPRCRRDSRCWWAATTSSRAHVESITGRMRCFSTN